MVTRLGSHAPIGVVSRDRDCDRKDRKVALPCEDVARATMRKISRSENDLDQPV